MRKSHSRQHVFIPSDGGAVFFYFLVCRCRVAFSDVTFFRFRLSAFIEAAIIIHNIYRG